MIIKLATCTGIGNHILFTELAGYNAARADFDSEYDNTAELGLNGIEVTEQMYLYVQDYSQGKRLIKNYIDESDEEEKLVAVLSVTMLDVYNNKLKARNRRKRYFCPSPCNCEAF